MKTLIHLSDLHFGRVDADALSALHERIAELRPDFIAVSGDLTQRAKASEYEAAAKFLNTLPCGYLIVPGNHDIPLYRFWERLFRPFGKYRHFVSGNMDPVYHDGECFAIAGITTPRSYLPKGGRVSLAQIDRLEKYFSTLPAEAITLVVSHHPVSPERRAKIIDRLEAGIDIWLSGHRHSKSVRALTGPRGTFIECSAGTAVSTRVRNARNSFNVLRLNHSELTVQTFDFEPGSREFLPHTRHLFHRSAGEWAEQ